MTHSLIKLILGGIVFTLCVVLVATCSKTREESTATHQAYVEKYPKLDKGDLVVHRLTEDTLLVVHCNAYGDIKARSKDLEVRKYMREEVKRINKTETKHGVSE